MTSPSGHIPDVGLAASPVQQYLESLHADYAGVDDGEVATYIPELGKADPAWFALCVVTVDGHVYAAGDVAKGWDPELGRRVRVEHYDNAAKQGAAAAANLLIFEADGSVVADNTDGLGLLGAFSVQSPSFDVAAAPIPCRATPLILSNRPPM